MESEADGRKDDQGLSRLWTSVGAWLSFAGELGKSLARWMTTGDQGMDMRQADINRFQPFQTNREYLTRQSKYFYEIGFDIIHPSQVASSVRNLRLSPYHDRMKALGGVFVPSAGIETRFGWKRTHHSSNNTPRKFQSARDGRRNIGPAFRVRSIWRYATALG